MAAEEGDSDKQYEPTQRKLDEARKKGEIARATDLTTAASYAGFIVALAGIGPAALLLLANALQVLLDQPDELAGVIFDGAMHPLPGGLLWRVITGIAPWLILPAALALLALAAQRALLFTPDKIAPKLDRISPLAGIKNKFGRQGLFEFAKSGVKLTIYTVIMGAFLIAESDRILATMALTPGAVLLALGDLVFRLMVYVLIVALVIGVIDYLWQHAEHLRKNRMSRKELMDEMKHSEGDPLMKQQRRQRGQEIAMNKMLVAAAGADVVITNPTHYAVALKWDRGAGGAPVCVAKGVDEIAARIRAVAAENAIPLHSDPPTARALYAETDLGDEIAPEHYRAVAAAIRFAEDMRRKAARR